MSLLDLGTLRLLSILFAPRRLSARDGVLRLAVAARDAALK